ncbi:MAG: Chemotaxis protein CheY [Phycisphaerae bacterium]|nr:Chemotaxis protein CheY [Phycisphaerae bacterium]
MTIRRVIIKSLALVGITDTAEASSGEEALRGCAAERFDVILMDWNMPGMSGIDALRHLREAGIKTPIIMVTTEAEKSRVIEAIRSGATDYLIKPFTPEQLAAKVKRATGMTE